MFYLFSGRRKAVYKALMEVRRSDDQDDEELAFKERFKER